ERLARLRVEHDPARARADFAVRGLDRRAPRVRRGGARPRLCVGRRRPAPPAGPALPPPRRGRARRATAPAPPPRPHPPRDEERGCGAPDSLSHVHVFRSAHLTSWYSATFHGWPIAWQTLHDSAPFGAVFTAMCALALASVWHAPHVTRQTCAGVVWPSGWS